VPRDLADALQAVPEAGPKRVRRLLNRLHWRQNIMANAWRVAEHIANRR
jgi:hypothetical protein